MQRWVWQAQRLRVSLFTSLSLVLVAGVPAHVRAQEMEVPVYIQVPLFLKVLAFDRRREQGRDVELVVAIAFQRRFRASLNARDEVQKAFQREANAGRHIRIVSIDLDREGLAESLQNQHVTLLYVAPLRAIDVQALAATASAAHVTTITGVPGYVALGLAVSTRLLGDRPKLVISLEAARLGGAEFTSELLKLAQVVP